MNTDTWETLTARKKSLEAQKEAEIIKKNELIDQIFTIQKQIDLQTNKIINIIDAINRIQTR
jgi:hypothetical protein